MDLMTLQNQLKVAIQNHQITVAKMKGEPQNSGLQKQLHDLQLEIMNLSEKQKQVVQQLRKDLEKKEGTGCTNTSTSTITTTGGLQTAVTASVAPRLLLSANPQSTLHLHRSTTLTVPPLPLGTSNKSPQSSGSVAATFASSPAAQHIIRQVVPSLVNNLVAAATGNVAFKTPIAAAVLLPSGATNAVFATSTTSAKGAENKTPVGPPQQSAPVLVVPSPALCSSEVSTSSSSLLVNLGPPIRVPQYPPPVSKSSSSSSSQSSSVSVSSSGFPDGKDQRLTPSTHNKSQSCSTKVASTIVTRASTKPKQEDDRKMNFLGSLGLVSKTTLNELQNKKGERKRRTTANPHFSNAAVEERRRHAAATALLQQATAPQHQHHHHNRFHGPFKRPRGRPRLNLTPGSSRPSTPESTSSLSPRDSPPSSVSVPQQLEQEHPPSEIHLVTKIEPKQPLPQPPEQTSPSISLLPLASISSSPSTNQGIKISTPSTTSGIVPPLSPLNTQTVLALTGLPQVLNGCLKPLAIRNGVAGERSCCICGLLVLMRLPTDGATCQQCKTLAHTHCVSVQSNISSQYYPGKPWTCPKCRKELLTAKEEDRQRLLKRRQELTTEQGHLKEKLKQLGQVAISQQKRHKEMMSYQHRVQVDIKRILDVVRTVQQCSPPPSIVSTTTTTTSSIKTEVESPS